MIFLDTSVLSLAFRRSKSITPEGAFIKQMIQDDWPLAIPGIVYQECLSGVKLPKQFSYLKEIFDAFPVILAAKEGHQFAAEIRNSCLRKGIASSPMDALIAAIRIHHGGKLYTSDRDYIQMKKVCNLSLL